jgi:uncharacterized protein (TIGR03437 family)
MLLALAPASVAQDTQWPTYGWATSTPEEQGMDSSRLLQAAAEIDRNGPSRYSLVVVRNGRLVFERYFHGSGPADSNNIKSISKSILSVLMGIAIDEGLVSGTDQKVAEFLPEYFRPFDDSQKLNITLEHLLTMRAGFRWEENSSISDECFRSQNWHKWVIESPLVDAPGTQFNYSTGLTHLGSGILTRRSGISTRAFAESRLFNPLGMVCYRWSQDPQGYFFGGSEVWITPRDLAKFGLLVLRKGMWDGRRIVSEDWLRASTRLRVRTRSELGDYAWWWWKYTIDGYPVTLASGYGGQNIFLVPELDLVVVTTARSNPSDNAYATYSQPYEVLGRYIIPAVTADPPKTTAVVHAADGGARLPLGSFATVFGSSLSIATVNWDDAMPIDGRLPDAIGGVRVTLGGRALSAAYASPGQVNFYIPPQQPAGTQRLTIATPQGSSSLSVEVVEAAPALYATMRDGVRLAAPAVRAGEAVDLRASGLGVTGDWPQVFLADRAVTVLECSVISVGVWNLRVHVPADAVAGVAAIRIDAGGVASEDGTYLEVTR